jgi:hypothetical protein
MILLPKIFDENCRRYEPENNTYYSTITEDWHTECTVNISKYFRRQKKDNYPGFFKDEKYFSHTVSCMTPGDI